MAQCLTLKAGHCCAGTRPTDWVNFSSKPRRNGWLLHHASAESGQLTELISAKVSDISTLIRTVKLLLGQSARSCQCAGSNPGQRRLFSACVAGTWPVSAHSLVSSLERMCQFMIAPPPSFPPPPFLGNSRTELQLRRRETGKRPKWGSWSSRFWSWSWR